MVLDAIVILLVLLLCNVLVRDGQDVSFDIDFDVFLLDARQVSLDLKGVLGLRQTHLSAPVDDLETTVSCRHDVS